MFFCEQNCNIAMPCCNIDVQVAWSTLVKLYSSFLMFITKLKVNLFHTPAIYVYLTFKLILSAISPVSRLESEYVYNCDCKSLRATCRSILQHCIAILQYCSQKNIRFGSKYRSSIDTRIFQF